MLMVKNYNTIEFYRMQFFDQLPLSLRENHCQSFGVYSARTTVLCTSKYIVICVWVYLYICIFTKWDNTNYFKLFCKLLPLTQQYIMDILLCDYI